jgi:hypothetical protein
LEIKANMVRVKGLPFISPLMDFGYNTLG